MWKRRIGMLLFILFILSSPGAGDHQEGIREYLHQFQESLDLRTEIFSLEIQEEENMLLLLGEVSEEETIQQFLFELAQAFEHPFLVEVKLLHEGYGLIQKPSLLVRKTPSDQGEVVTQLLYHTPVRILKETGGFFLIQGPDAYLGWIPEETIISFPTSRDFHAFIQQGRTGLVHKEESLLWSRPYADEKIEILHGTRLQLGRREGDWYPVMHPEKELWIQADDLLLKGEIRKSSEEILATARFYQNTPYLWGGTTIAGADCSGFVQRVLDFHGIFYPRDSDQQYQFGEIRPLEERKPGDLLFFSTYQEGASHVGFYLGENEFIHCSSAAESVIIHSLNPQDHHFNAYLKDRLLGVQPLVWSKKKQVSWLRE